MNFGISLSIREAYQAEVNLKSLNQRYTDLERRGTQEGSRIRIPMDLQASELEERLLLKDLSETQGTDSSLDWPENKHRTLNSLIFKRNVD